MALVSRSIPTLLRGVSQAAESTKQPDHADIQDNADSDPVLGLAKRSGSQFVSNLINGETSIGNAHVITINRDTNERYVAVFTNNNIRVFDLDGTEKTVTKPDGVSYLSCTNPRSQIKTITIADFTFVVNTTVTTAMDSTLSAGGITQAIVFFKQVTDATTYSVTVDGFTATKNTASDNPLSTSVVASAIQSSLQGGLTGFTIERNGPVLHVKKDDNSNFSIDSSDTQGNSQITTVKNSVQQFTDLPTVSPNGMIVEVKGDESTNFDNYYVRFSTNNGGTFEEGQWEESVEAGIKFKFNYDTMPHVLVSQADGNFRFARVDGDTYTVSGQSFNLPIWGERTVGDEDSAPSPSFIGFNINNVFFFRNRLGFLSADNVILSRVSEFFEFFPETVLSVIDSDPIDVAASHTKVAILKNAISMGEKLILFSEQTQFNLTSSSDSLTPTTANVIVTTEFESTDSAQPVGSGSSIYYLTEKGNFAGVREYISQQGIEVKDAANITIHVPRLIPKDIFKIAVSTNEDILVLLGATNPNVLYVNRWLYGARSEKILNSWFTYTFDSGRAIKNIDFIGTDLFMVTETIVPSNFQTELNLEKIPFASDYKEPNSTFQYHLDRKFTESSPGVSVTYSSNDLLTTITCPYKMDNDKMSIISRDLAPGETSTMKDIFGNERTVKPGEELGIRVNITGINTLQVPGDIRNTKFIIGEPYEMKYRFSSQRLTESSGGQKSGEIISGRLQLKHFYLKFENTGFIKVEVTPDNNETSTHLFTSILGTGSTTLGSVALDSGTFKVPIMSRADRVTIDVKNDTFLPTVLSSAEYEAMFHMRSRRI